MSRFGRSPILRFFGVLARADRRLAIAWWGMIAVRSFVPAVFVVAMGATVSAVDRGSSLVVPLTAIGIFWSEGYTVQKIGADGKPHDAYPATPRDALEPLSVRVSYESQKRIEDVVFGIAVYDLADGRHLYGANTEMLGAPIPFVDGAGEVVFDIASVPLLDGTYPITLGIHSHDDGIVYDSTPSSPTTRPPRSPATRSPEC